MEFSAVTLLNCFGAALGAALAAPLLLLRSCVVPSARLLGSLLLMVSSAQILITLDHSLAGRNPWIEGIEVSLTLLSGPLLLSFVQGQFVWRKRWGGLHLAPSLAALCFLGVGGLWSGFQEPDFTWIVCVQMGYTLSATYEHLRSPRADESPTWSRLVLLFFYLIHAAQWVRLSTGGNEFFRDFVPLTLTLAFVLLTSLGFALALKRRDGSSKTSVDEAEARKCLRRLDRLFEAERLYREPDLDLRTLAAAAGVKPHFLSEVLNQHGRESFFDLVNRHRIGEARRLLRDSDYDHYSLEGVGKTAGFKSRSTFYARFKETVGQTPGQYRRRR